MAKKIHIPKCGLKSKKICLTIGGGKAGFITVNCTGMCVDRQIWELLKIGFRQPWLFFHFAEQILQFIDRHDHGFLLSERFGGWNRDERLKADVKYPADGLNFCRIQGSLARFNSLTTAERNAG